MFGGLDRIESDPRPWRPLGAANAVKRLVLNVITRKRIDAVRGRARLEPDG